jgi:uncharacterized repeat protein (TIGR01451 family)
VHTDWKRSQHNATARGSGAVLSDASFTFQNDAAPQNDQIVAIETHGAQSGYWQNNVPSPSFMLGNSYPSYYWCYDSTDTCIPSDAGSGGMYTTSMTITPTVSGENGTFYLRVQGEDTSGHLTAPEVAFVFMYDNVPPTNPPATAITPTLGTQCGHDSTGVLWCNGQDSSITWSPAVDSMSGVLGYAWDVSTISGAGPSWWTTSPGTGLVGDLRTGAYYLNLVSEDNALNESGISAYGPYYVDRDAPTNPTAATETHGAISNAWQNTVITPTFTWTGASAPSGVAGYFWCFDSTGQCDPAAAGTWTTSTTVTPTAPGQGVFYLRVKTESNAGNVSPAATPLFTYAYDDTPPTNPVAFEEHGVDSGTWQNSVGAPAFGWIGATDSLSGVAGYWWCFDQANTCSPSAGTWTTSEAATPAAPGQGTFYLRLQTQDYAGNVSAPAALFVFEYDSVPPNNPTTISGGLGDSCGTYYGTYWCNGHNGLLSWSGAVDPAPGSGVRRYYWDLSASPGAATTFRTTYTNTGILNLTPGGAYYLNLQTDDYAGNISGVQAYGPYHMDTTAPDNPANAYETHGVSSGVWQNVTSSPSFTWTVGSDADSGVAGYYWCFDDATLPSQEQCDPVTSGTYTTRTLATPAPPGQGTFALLVKTRDNVGNVSGVAAPLFTFDYDNTPPANPITATEAHGVISGTWQNQWSAPDFGWSRPKDNLSGVKGYWWCFDATNSCTPSDALHGGAWTSWESASPAAPGQGTFYLRVQTQDYAGNVSAPAMLFVFKYAPPPALSVAAAPVAADGTAQAGTTLTYTVRLTNTTELTLTNVVVSATLPPGLIPVPGSITGGGAVVGTSVSWALGAVAPGSARDLSYQIAVPGGYVTEDSGRYIRTTPGLAAQECPATVGTTSTVLITASSPPAATVTPTETPTAIPTPAATPTATPTPTVGRTPDRDNYLPLVVRSH